MASQFVGKNSQEVSTLTAGNLILGLPYYNTDLLNVIKLIKSEMLCIILY